jgi:hypothetical protein
LTYARSGDMPRRMRTPYLLPLLAALAIGCHRDADASRNAPPTLTSATVVPSAPWNGSYEFTESSGEGTAKMGTLEEIGATDYVIFVAGEASSPRVTVTSTGVRKIKFVGRGVPRGDALGIVFEASPLEREAPNLTKGDEAFTLTRSGEAVSLVFAKLPPTGSQKTLLRSPPRTAAPTKKASACKHQFAGATPIDVVGTVHLKTVKSKKVYVIEPQSTLCSPSGDVVREVAIENPLHDMDQVEDALAELPLVIRSGRAEETAWVGHLKTSANSAFMLRVMDH